MSNIIEGAAAYQKGKGESAAYTAKADYDRRVAEINARQMEMQAGEAKKQGDKAAAKNERETQRLMAEQRVSMATGGGDLGGEQAQVIREQTLAVSAADEAALKVNAWRQAWGLESGAEQTRLQGVVAERSGKYMARQSMISGKLGLAAGVSRQTEQAIKSGMFGG